MTDAEIQALKALSAFLGATFKGSSFGPMKIDDTVVVLNKAISLLQVQPVFEFGCDANGVCAK